MEFIPQNVKKLWKTQADFFVFRPKNESVSLSIPFYGYISVCEKTEGKAAEFVDVQQTFTQFPHSGFPRHKREMPLRRVFKPEDLC